MPARIPIPDEINQHDFEELYRKEPHPRTRIRLLGMAHVQAGKSFSRIARMLKVSREAVRDWVKRFSQEGTAGLFEKPGRGAKPKLSPEDEPAFEQALEQLHAQRSGGRVTGEDIRQMLAERFHAEYTLGGVYKLLKRLDLVWITARSIHPETDPEAQEAFKKGFPEKVKAVLPSHVEIADVDIWFQDEARVGQRGTVTRIWAKKGTRPRTIRQQQYLFAYLFGAVCPNTDQAVGLALPFVNTEAMDLHLETISDAVPQGRHAVLVADGAAWHTTDKLTCPENISLLPLPPYSPELNPMENLWEHLRQKWLANRCFEGYEAILDACCDAWNAFTDKAGAIKQLCSRSWAVLQT